MNKFGRRTVAVEIVNAGKCNMDCEYCYIPKSKQMNILHEEVVEYLDSGKWLDDLEEVYGDALEIFSPWGTEPTLTIDIFTKWMPEVLKRFPKLNGLQFSSNFLRNPDCILALVDVLPKDREFSLAMQYSIDGPEWITDVCRHKNATKRITSNIKYFMSEMVKRDTGMLEVRMNCKPTWNENIIAMIGEDISLVDSYLDFFNEFFGELDEIIGCSTLKHNKVHAPFLGLPGQYLQYHGIMWAKITEKMLYEQMEHRRNGKWPNLAREFCGYVPRIQRVLDFGKDFFTKPEMFTCSAGDSQYALDHKGYLHSCHRTFYLNDDNYVDSIKDTTTAASGNWDYEHYKSDRLGDIRKNMMAKIGDDNAFHKFAYYNASHHHFIQNRINIYSGLLKVMAKAGQVNEVYYDDYVARFASGCFATGFNCNVEYQLTLGSMSLIPVGLLRLNCNGAFEMMMEAATGGWDRLQTDWFKA